ncbi:hypothetical protein Goshw_016124 [Gossypium schwendimanii]|uniref:Uncharacterized protein n=1 Tax=Gossypium schwendimanii TaxID=34291 RepID=A0A7J9N9X3_GOSSC|nr:hypothetical protein [Gossypium schwendimanii]
MEKGFLNKVEDNTTTSLASV